MPKLVTKNQIKFVQSLHRKKYRQKYSQFIVEGVKSVDELIHSAYKIDTIYALPDWINEHNTNTNALNVVQASKTDLERMSYFKTASPVIAVANNHSVDSISDSAWVLCLDDIKDPGNLGTIIRIADWYGITSIYASLETVDLYNPKTIASTMGSFTRVHVTYANLLEICESSKKQVFFTQMAGESIYTLPKHKEGIIVVGNEANGISDALLSTKHIDITIPKTGGAESLNAGVATAIVCDRLLR